MDLDALSVITKQPGDRQSRTAKENNKDSDNDKEQVQPKPRAKGWQPSRRLKTFALSADEQQADLAQMGLF